MASTNKVFNSNADGGKDDPSFFSMENLKVIQVPLIGGLLNGFSVGFVGVYAQMYLISTDCSMYKSPDACGSVPNANCLWETVKESGTCGWEGFTCSARHGNNEAACLADSRCNWIYDDKKCMNPTGFGSSKSGIFAGAMVVGCMIGSLFSGQFASRFGYKVSFLIVGIVGVVSSVMYHVAAGVDQFWVLCVGRLLIGVVLGLVCVACPMYVDQNAPRKFLKVDGVLFQVFGTFANMFSSTIGLALGQSINYDNNAQIVARMEGFCAFSTLFSVLVVLLGVFINESKTKFVGKENADKKEEDEAALDPNEYSYWQMLGPLFMGVVTAGTLQLTGINAVMNYAPTMMGRLGMEPLIGNFVVMLWNFLTPIIAIPLARFFTMRRIYLTTMFVGSCACLFLCGIPVYPGVTSENVKNGVAITGIIVFIAAFEFGIGPGVGVLAQQLSPPSFRPKATAVTMVTQFIFNIIINVCYPIVTEAASGGPSGNQDKGQAIAFIFFGGMGFIAFVLSLFFLFPWEDTKTTNTVPEMADEAIEEIYEHSPVEVATIRGNQRLA